MQFSWLSLVDLSRRKNPQHLRVALPLKPQRVVGKERVRDLGGVGEEYWVHSSPFTLSPVPRLDTVQQMDRGGRGVTPSAIRGGTLLSDTAPAACQKRFINASRGGSARSPSVLRDPRQPGQSTAVAQKWGAAERWPGGMVPSPPAVDPAGVTHGFSVPLCPSPLPWGQGPCALLPLRQGTRGLRSAGPGGGGVIKPSVFFS